MVRVVWFKRDLRVDDNAALAAACDGDHAVLPLYIFEPELWRQPEMSGRHFEFLLESLRCLDTALRALGSALRVETGDAVEIFERINRSNGIEAVHAHEETGLLWTYARDRRVRAWAKRAGVPVVEVRQHGVWRASQGRDGWAQKWDRMMARPAVPTPARVRGPTPPGTDWPDAAALGLDPDPCTGRQRGGRAEGLGQLRSFLTARGRGYRKDMSSPAAGAASCSRISAHLAMGSVSIREAYQAALTARAQWRAAGDADYVQSIESFVARLHWHCHFMQKLEDAPEFERTAMHPAAEGLRPIEPEHAAIVERWATGQTGYPFVDACMRSLRATGWLNFRMRSMAMAFSSYHLWQDWRLPSQALARMFTDFEPGIHFPQVQMQSGTTGVNTARIYNPVKQSRDQDPNGEFIRTWVPELASLSNDFIHEPWRAPDAYLAARGVRLGDTYPSPIVDHVAAAARAREAIYGLRRGAGFRAVAQEIVAKHGSRKSGLPPAERKAKAARKASTQRSFEF
jgi:deoxyribodipyrimidine photo-lyase